MEYLWIVIAGFLFSFFLSFSIGANDTANSFGTSVGSKVLSLRKAYILAIIFETCGAILLGSKVTDTMRSGVIDAAVYNQSEKAYISGQLATKLYISGCGVWMMLATLFKLPVSTTHSMVGATLGYSIVLRHFQGVRWLNIGYIVASWFLSPILSGLITTVFYMTINASILKRDQAAMRGLNLLPYFYFFTFLINIFSVFYDGSAILKFNEIPFWAICLVSVVFSFLTALAVRITVVPKLRRNPVDQEDPQCVKLFSFLQILSACFSGFAHGGNDVSNSIAPLVTIWNMYAKGPAGIEDGVPIWLLAYGSAGMSIGLWLLGHRVIRTVGEGLTELNAISGFCVELAAAFTVLFASKLGLPISTTHCKIGSVVAVGYIRFARKVNLTLFRNIILSWVVTLPATG
ncbi:sodium dependent phosphate transporter 1 [Trichuris trichiura]|uniref:Phosphate transporter n=1 Tax=Trichuris trichiura TaxID=36087 RepID=A0A077Z7N5_TRITR|nr:sodium dependent phosphate transporter 1 [Trichuris trichiura]